MNSSSATSSVALGSNNNANGSSSIAIGDRNSASASNAVAIGTQASSSRSNTIAIGKGAIADTSSGIAIGENAGVGSSQGSTTDRVEHIAIGKNSGQNVVGNQNIAIGSGAGSNLSPDNNSSSDSNIAIGIAAGSGINCDDNISIGRNSNTNGGAITRSVTLGSETKSSSQSVVVGNSSKVTSGTDATIVGYNAQVTGTGGIALGANTQAAANNIALGINSDASTNSTTKAYLVSDTIPDVATVGYSVVSVGNGTTTRRITNVAPGGNPTDAVNVSQLTQLHNDVSSILGLTGSTDGKFGEVNVNGTTYGSIIAAIAAGGGGGGTLPTDYYVTYTNQAQNEINLGPNGGKGTTINNVATATNDDQAVNLGQVKALAKDATVKYVSINSTDGANKLSDQAIANNSVAIGPSTGTTAVAENSIALGSNVRTEALNGIAIGNSGTRAKGESSIAIGKENTTADINNIALGTLVSTKGIDSIGIGKNVQTDATSSTTNYAIAIGSDAEVQNSDQAIVIGRKAIVSQDNGVAIGNEALTQGEQGISIGRQATSSAENTTAIGNKASSSGQSANAIGDNAKAQAKDANAMGTAANASALNALALGTGASASSENSTAIGNQARASASDAVALGNGAVSQAQQAIAIGKTATAYAKNAIATGTNANAYAENSIALGSNTTVNNNHANAVALGSNSVSGDYNQTTKSTINGRDYNYAGSGAGLSTVSVGTKDNERQIINVAAGRVTATSTDAVNGSQLFAVQEEVQKPLSFAGDSGTKVDRKLGDQLKVTGGASGTLTEGNIGVVANGSDTLQLKLAKDVNLTNAGSLTVGSTKLTDGKVEIKDASNNSNVSTSTNTVMTAGASSNTIDANSITLKNAANNVVLSGTTGTLTGLTNKTLTVSGFATQGRAATEEQLKLVNDTANKGWNITTNKDTANKSNVAPDATVDFSNSDKNITVSHSGTNVDLKLAEVVNIGGQSGGATISVNGKNGTITGLTNKTFDPNNYTTGRAATEDQLATPLTFTGDNAGVNVQRKLGQQLSIVGGESVAANLTDNNIGVVADSTNNKLTVNTGLRFVDTTTGLPLTNTPSISLGGINAGNQIITNVSPGKNGTDAVNVNQLNDVKAIAEEGWVFTTATSGKGQTVNSSLQTIKPNQRFTMISGDNVELIQNGDKVTITTTPAVSFDKVTVGNVIIDNTTNKITGVEAGTVASNSKDAVNGSQLHDLGSGVRNIIGGNTTYDPSTGTYTNNNIGDTGQNNINDAIKSINDTAQNANKGWTVSTNGQNASQVKPSDTVDFANKDGNININNTGNNITVDLAKDIQVDSVIAGDTTVNNNGLTINGGPSVTKNGIDAAGNKVTGVAEGSIAQSSKDAVNGSQIHDIIGDGAFQGGDGNTITNIGGTGATNINDAIGSINQKAGQHSTVEAGQNITVKESTNSNGGKEYTVATADDVKFNSVTSNTVTANNVKVGDVNIDQNGINAGNHKITNVAPGEISSTSKDAVNGSQLNTSNQYIVNSLGGGAKYENGQFTAPTYNVNNGSYNNVGDALGALNQADINLGNRITNLGDRLEQVFYNVNGRIDDVEKKANAGIASAMALEGAPFVAGKFTYAVGAAYHGGENAVGATLRKTADNGRWSITGGVAAASQGDPSVRVGISGVID